jgi:hypothetical protein
MKKFKVWRVVFMDMGHEGSVFVRAETPEDALKLGVKVMAEDNKFHAEHLTGLEIVSIVWED